MTLDPKRLANFLSEGNHLRDRLGENPLPIEDHNAWVDRIKGYLSEQGASDYVVRFSDFSGMTFYGDGSDRSRMSKSITGRCQRLQEFIAESRSHRVAPSSQQDHSEPPSFVKNLMWLLRKKTWKKQPLFASLALVILITVVVKAVLGFLGLPGDSSEELPQIQKTPVHEAREFQAIKTFREANMKYYSNHVDFIVENFSAKQKEMTSEEQAKWDSHSDGKELGSYDLARDSFDELNDVFKGQLDDYKAVWLRAKDELWDLNDETWISRASLNWKKRVEGGKDEEYNDTGVPKGSKREFLKSARYLEPTEGFKKMVNEIAKAATDLIDKSS